MTEFLFARKEDVDAFEALVLDVQAQLDAIEATLPYLPETIAAVGAFPDNPPDDVIRALNTFYQRLRDGGNLLDEFDILTIALDDVDNVLVNLANPTGVQLSVPAGFTFVPGSYLQGDGVASASFDMLLDGLTKTKSNDNFAFAWSLSNIDTGSDTPLLSQASNARLSILGRVSGNLRFRNSTGTEASLAAADSLGPIWTARIDPNEYLIGKGRGAGTTEVAASTGFSTSTITLLGHQETVFSQHKLFAAGMARGSLFAHATNGEPARKVLFDALDELLAALRDYYPLAVFDYNARYERQEPLLFLSVADVQAFSTVSLRDGTPMSIIGETAGAYLGGGDFYYDAGDTTTADDGFVTLVDLDGRRWKRVSQHTEDMIAMVAGDLMLRRNGVDVISLTTLETFDPRLDGFDNLIRANAGDTHLRRAGVDVVALASIEAAFVDIAQLETLIADNITLGTDILVSGVAVLNVNETDDVTLKPSTGTTITLNIDDLNFVPLANASYAWRLDTKISSGWVVPRMVAEKALSPITLDILNATGASPINGAAWNQVSAIDIVDVDANVVTRLGIGPTHGTIGTQALGTAVALPFKILGASDDGAGTATAAQSYITLDVQRDDPKGNRENIGQLTFDKAIAWLTGQSFVVANNAHAEFTIPGGGAMVFIVSQAGTPASQLNGIFYFDGNAAAAPEIIATSYTGPFARVATALTGTTGAVGDITLGAPGDGKGYIENRIGGSRTFNVLVFRAN